MELEEKKSKNFVFGITFLTFFGNYRNTNNTNIYEEITILRKWICIKFDSP